MTTRHEVDMLALQHLAEQPLVILDDEVNSDDPMGAVSAIMVYLDLKARGLVINRRLADGVEWTITPDGRATIAAGGFGNG